MTPPPPPPPKPGVIPLAPLGINHIYGGAFATLRRYAGPLFGVTAVAYAALIALGIGLLALVYAFLGDDLRRSLSDLLESGDAPSWAEVRTGLGTLAVTWGVTMLASLIVNSFVMAASPTVVEHAVVGRRTTFGAVWRKAWRRTPAVLGVTFLMYLMMLAVIVVFALLMVGMVLSVASLGESTFPVGLLFLLLLVLVPLAVWLMVLVSLAPAAAVLESAGPLRAIRRSAHLIRGAWWRTFGILLLTMAMAAIAMYAMQLPLMLAGPDPVAYQPDASTQPDVSEIYARMVPDLGIAFVVVLLVSWVVQLVAAAFVQLVTTLLYVDRRIRTEGLADALAESAAPR
ncbi:hypothetical protein DSC45_11340 [Streptomyces sp. YIM 130001]|uniref:DUF7847 domain-containing protein n=1 Tax=Streptomyces sp. YIM 130001 TaxID=2259644 RepID=UPI000E6582ED|nr:hypothetical protein [Streptomyces sp. YIM 130001]RII18503.1 hypothetical protein DSC45_11340 [Streptomyces sp. YIM 130001]